MVFRETLPDGTVRLSGGMTSGIPGDKGEPGDTGPPGPPGPSGISSIDFTFAMPNTTWTCVHSLGHKQVDVFTSDLNGTKIIGDVEFVDDDTVQITWYYAMTGIATIQL